ncbi:hypothetical protein SDC9_196009 [bioreactor metagenome]|uniref:Uncharacterized protein n=1 Tax=bioreactor metagenome TaxID=1076179 RepID=A0A645IC41_9ZZZZ
MFGRQQVENQLLLGRQRLQRFKVGIIFHHRFTFELQSRRHGCLIDITQGTQIITRKPLPEPILKRQQHRRIIQHSKQLLYFILRRRTIMHIADNCRVILLSPKRNHHPAARLNRQRQVIGNGIRISSVQWQRQYNIYIFFHRRAKVQKSSYVKQRSISAKK